MMKTFAIVPVKRFENAKMRLSSMLDIDDRMRLSSLMLDHTLEVLASIPSLRQVVVVSEDNCAREMAEMHGAKFLREQKESGVNSAVALANSYCIKEEADSTLVIPHDLPLLDGVEISRACALAKNESKCVIICPSFRYDGTNMLLRKPPYVISTFYDSDSYNMHVKSAIELGIPVKLFFAATVMHDVDTPEDARTLAKGYGNAKTLEFLRSKF
jgi:2-phospho-L-lactate/phosphoenolpyruvate guanylyltransferase